MLLVAFESCQIDDGTINHKDKKECNMVIIYKPHIHKHSTYDVLTNVLCNTTNWNVNILNKCNQLQQGLAFLIEIVKLHYKILLML